MDNLILSPVPIQDLLEQMRLMVREELSHQQPGTSNSSLGKPISEKELCEFLGITLPTAIRWRKKGKLPFMRIGTCIRYDLNKVTAALEKNK